MAHTSFLTSEIVHKIKEIEVHTKRLLRSTQVGDSRSALKGTGFEFDQIRHYQTGDDVRFIDWNASARMNTLLIKQYIEERSRTIMLAVDLSASQSLGSQTNIKRDTAAQVASVLALVSDVGQDRVGLLLFTDKVELYIPPARGKPHVHTIMRNLFGYTAKGRGTNITEALKHLAQLKQHDALIFLISDFIDETMNHAYLSCIAKRHDLIAVRCLDPHEYNLPSIGFLPIQDSETGEQLVLDTRQKSTSSLRAFLHNRVNQQTKILKRYGATLLDIENNSSFIGTIIRFFRRRMRY